MQIGDLIESAIWITGDESPQIRSRYEQDVIQAVADLCSEAGFEHGPVIFTEKRPGDDRVPPVPDHIQGSRVRLLVGGSKLLCASITTSEGSFIANLEKKDLTRLRFITRNSWLKQNPGQVLTDGECDKIIEEFGPEAAIDTLRSHTLQ